MAERAVAMVGAMELVEATTTAEAAAAAAAVAVAMSEVSTATILTPAIVCRPCRSRRSLWQTGVRCVDVRDLLLALTPCFWRPWLPYMSRILCLNKHRSYRRQ
jgi:hypothetical protein